MTDVIAGEEEIGRPIRLEHRGFKTIFDELVFIAVNQIDIAMHLQSLHNLKKRIRLEDIIVVKKSDPFPVSELESTIRRSRNACVSSKASQGNPTVAPGNVRQDAKKVGVR